MGWRSRRKNTLVLGSCVGNRRIKCFELPVIVLKYQFDFCIIKSSVLSENYFILLLMSRFSQSSHGFCYKYNYKINGLINHVAISNEWKVQVRFPRILDISSSCKYGICACCKSEAKHCPMLQYITQTLQRAICTNPANTIAIELQLMIMPY